MTLRANHEERHPWRQKPLFADSSWRRRVFDLKEKERVGETVRVISAE